MKNQGQDTPVTSQTHQVSLKKLFIAEEKLGKFRSKIINDKPISFSDMMQAFDLSEWAQEVIDKAETGSIEIASNPKLDPMLQQISSEFNQAAKEIKVRDLSEMYSDKLGTSALWFLLNLGAMMRVVNVRTDIDNKAKDIGDKIAQKNEERYNYNASLRSFSPVIAARRAEIEAMLDEADVKKLGLSR